MKPKMTRVILILFFLTMGFTPVIWAPAPTATTLSATSITSTSAVLRGSINPGGLATQWDFASCDSSSSPTYFSPTPLQNLAAGSTAVTVSHTLTGLLPGMTYKYVVRAVNSAGSQNGSCVTFTTGAGTSAPTATTLSATSITSTSAVLRGSINPGGLATQWDFASCDSSSSPTYFSPTPLQNLAAGSTAVTVSHTLTGLLPGMTYKYTVRAVNSAGSQNGSCVTFTTSGGGAATAVLTTNKPDYALGETVLFTLANTGGSPFTGTVNNPFTIYKRVGASWLIVYTPGIAMQNWTLNPGDTKTWSWGQTSNTMVTIDAGTYKVEVDLSGVGSWDTTFTIGMGGGGGQPSEEDDDGDGVSNSDDACYNPDCNLVNANGCPKDTDNDGLNDCEDDCPRDRGSAANDGCPEGERDRDSDGVSDDDDACFNPDCNIVDTQGCPKDTDGDGLDDCKDDCPSEAGERQNDGCPSEDADNDGVADDQDNCYNPGCNRVDSRGCPYDSDGDGLNDCEDNCPNQAGSRNNNGCPEPGPSFCLGSLLLSMLVFLGILFKT